MANLRLSMLETLSELHSSREHLSALCQPLTAAQACYSPQSGQLAPAEWSIAQILEHLNTVERGQRILIARTLKLAPATAEQLAGTAGKLDFIWERMASPVRKISAPEFSVPKSTHEDWPAILTQYLETRGALIELYEANRGGLDRHVAPHPIAGLFTLEQWFAFAAAHSRRHAIQIEAMLTAVPAGV
jgi:hypothetical protein